MRQLSVQAYGALLSARQLTALDLRDHHVAGDVVKYLDGSDWTASTTLSPPGTGACSFQEDVDFDNGSDGPNVPVSSKEECCDACWSSQGCAGAVFTGGTCWLKTIAQIQKPSSQSGRHACIRDGGSKDLSIAANVPGDLLSDLYKAGQIENPYYEDNWLVNSSLWNDNVWTYTTSFDSPSSADGEQDHILVFDGVKMGAHVKVNGEDMGDITDQFLQYIFELKSLKPEGNTLEVIFPGATLECGGRWMACSGGWDWAPYSDTTQEGSRTFSKGIWKSVYVASVNQGGAFIEHVVPHTFYKGPHAVTPLEEGKHAGFDVSVRVHLRSQADTQGQLCVGASWLDAKHCETVDVPAGTSNHTLQSVVADAEAIKLWWPAGIGSQPLYDVNVDFTPSEASSVSAKRRIGFRHIAVVTSNDTDPDVVERASHEEGSDDHGLSWRVNGALILMKGANMIPMEEMEGWMDADAHRILVESAVEAKMNTLRVWGGGMFLPQVWYDACDELGIVIYHDMQYAQDGHSPQSTPNQEAELRHQIRRLSHHPSIVVWDGCNECQVKMNTGTAIYATFVLTVVAEEDQSRALWPSCPAKGWTKGVHKLSALPNGNALETPDNGRSIEVHGPYYHGSGFPSVNGGNTLKLIDSKIPLNLQQKDVGATFQNQMASEFGASVMSSFESMSATLAPEHWSLHAGQPNDNCDSSWDSTCTGDNVMAQRNYPCDNFIYSYFGSVGHNFNVSSEANFKKQLYQCMTAQALLLKQNIEELRGGNTFGILVWQYNEIWPTGGWGSIEYGNPNFPGQVIGGRWKPLQYWYKASLFADVMATCGAGGLCYVRNDAPQPFQGQLTLRSIAFADASVDVNLQVPLSLPAGAGALQWMQFDELSAIDGTTHILEAVVTDSSGAQVSANVVPYVVPAEMKLKESKVSVTAVQGEDGSFIADVKTEAVAMYVTLTTLAHGNFEDNSFLLLPPGRRIKFNPVSPSPHGSTQAAYESFADSLRVEDVSAYAVAPTPAPPCKYMQDVDFDTSSTSGQTVAFTQEECCTNCWNSDTCAAAVYVDGDHSCWMKTADQVPKQVTSKGRLACVRDDSLVV